MRDQWISLAVILAGYWAAFALYRFPRILDYTRVGVSGEWLKEHGQSGFAAHWNKNSNSRGGSNVVLNLFRAKNHSSSTARLRDAQFHPDPWDDDPRTHRRRRHSQRAPTFGEVKWFLIAGVVVSCRER